MFVWPRLKESGVFPRVVGQEEGEEAEALQLQECFNQFIKFWKGGWGGGGGGGLQGHIETYLLEYLNLWWSVCGCGGGVVKE